MPPPRPEEFEYHKQFARAVSELGAIFADTDAFIRLKDIPSEIAFTVRFAIEEIFTNMVKYNPAGKSKILLCLTVEDGRFVVQLVDADSDYFDPTKAPELDLEAKLAQMKPGGLGIHLIKKMADEFLYDYSGRTSTLTIIKSLE